MPFSFYKLQITQAFSITATLTKQLDDEDKVDCVELNLEKILEIG